MMDLFGKGKTLSEKFICKSEESSRKFGMVKAFGIETLFSPHFTLLGKVITPRRQSSN